MTFHLAIPCNDIFEAVSFYETIGAKLGRKYSDSAILNFFDTQLVVHLTGKWDREATMYPRHFGVILKSYNELYELWNRWQYAKFIFEEMFVRHKDKPEEHHTFFINDPSNNTIEFKWYKNKAAVFS